MKKHVLSSLLLAFAIGASAAGWQPISLYQKASTVKISETIHAMVVQNDTLFAATADGVWASPSGFGGDFVAYGLQGQNVRLLNFKVKKLAIVATTDNFQPLYEMVGGAWVRNTTLPVDAAITGGVNFEQKLNADNSVSIVIPTGSVSSGRIYSSVDGGATFTSAIPSNAFVSVGVNTFDGDPNIYFPNSAKVATSAEANNNQTSFYFSSNGGVSFARKPSSYSIATGIPANFIFKMTAANGHTYHFMGGQKDVIRVDSLSTNTTGAPISWNNPANMKSFSTLRTVAITDGATNLTTFPTYNFKKMLLGVDSKLYLLSDKALHVSTDDGATYSQVFEVGGDTILTSLDLKASYLFVGSNHGVLTNYDLATDKVNATVMRNDSLFMATENGVWLSKDKGANWSAFGLQGQEVLLLNFKVKKLAIVATTGNFQPLYEMVGDAWVRNTTLPVDAAITGGVNFEQKLNADNSVSIVIPTGSVSNGRIYSSVDGGATFTSAIPSNAFVSVGVNTFDGDPNIYFPNSAKVATSAEANNNQTSFYFSSNGGATFARKPSSYSIATGIPANFIYKMTAANGHTYHFMGGQKDVVRVDSLSTNTTGAPISWNNPANMKSFSTLRTVAITDGATNLTTFPTYNFKKILTTANGKLYLLADKALYISHNDGETYAPALEVGGDTILTSLVADGNNLVLGTNKGLLKYSNIFVNKNEKVNALVLQNDSLFAATENGVWLSKDKGANWSAFGLQGQEVLLLNFKVKKLAIVATTGNFQPLYEMVGDAWVRNTTLPVDAAITGGVNFEQKLNADNTLSIVIPTGSVSSGRIYSSVDGGATFTSAIPSNAFVSVGVNTFDGDPNIYFPNSAKVATSAEANNNQTSFYFSSNGGATFARKPSSYSIATGIPANFIYKMTAANGHTYHFMGGQKDVVRVDSLSTNTTGAPISWNNPANMKSFSTLRTVAITDGATNLTTFPTYNFKKILTTANGKLYLLADKALYISHNDGETYAPALEVGGDTILNALVEGTTDLYIGSSVGLLTLAIDNSAPNAIDKLNDNSNINVYSVHNGIRVKAEGIYNVTIYGLTGQVIFTSHQMQGEVTIPLASNKSIYLVKVDTNKGSQVTKVIR